jgi:hypothetical protein
MARALKKISAVRLLTSSGEAPMAKAGAAATRATKEIEAYSSVGERAVDTDMGGAERSAAACNKTESVAVDEAGKAVIIGLLGLLTSHYVVVKGSGSEIEPARGARDGTAEVVEEHEPPRCRRMNIEGENFERVQLGIAASVVPHKDDLIGLTDGLAAERRELGVGKIEHVVIAELLLVEPGRDRI